MSRKHLAQATMVVVMLGAVSKLMGFFREQIIAIFFGATGRTDAFITANLIPTMVIGMLSGPLSTAFLPVFASHVANGDKEGARRLASSVVTLACGAVVLISLAAVIPAPWLVSLVAPGFEGERFQSTVMLARVFFPAMVLPLLSAFAKAILNSHQEFTIPSISPVIQNLVIVAVISVLAPTLGLPSLAVGLVLGYLVAFLIQLPAVKRTGSMPGLSLSLDPSVKKVLGMALPLMAGSLASQAYLVVDKNLASHLPEGSIAALGFADRLRQVPLGLFVAAVVTVIYPTLSTMWAKKDKEGFRDTAIMGLRYVEFICIPASVGLMVLATPIVRLVFEHGAFTAGATGVTAAALLSYSPALVGMAATQITGIAFYSSQETRIPVAIGVGIASLNIVLDLILVRMWGHVGLALANSIAALAGAFVSITLLSRFIGGLPIGKLTSSLIKILISSLAMAATAVALGHAVGFWTGSQSFLRDALNAAVVVGTAVVVYLGVAFVLRCEEISVFMSLVKGKLGSLRRKRNEG